MRILIAAPPKTGNMWLKCLLGNIYDLEWIKPKQAPPQASLEAFGAWAANGNWSDGTIFHQHYDYDEKIVEIANAAPAHLVTLVRNPYDAFVSTYFTLQQHFADNNRKQRKMTALMGKQLDDPLVIEFLRQGGYHNNLVKARDWMTSGHAVVLRYEALHADPAAELTRATDLIAPASPAAIEAAVRACSADAMRQASKGMARHVRAARPDDARSRLTEEHYSAFRDTYGPLIEELGYDVR